MRNRIAIFGGTFDPLHNGHIKIAKLAFDNFNLSKIYFVPAFISPHKTDKKNISSPLIRFEMVQKAINEYKEEDSVYKFEVSDFEVLKKNESYTIDTITYFKSKILTPTDQLFIIIGEDSKNSFHTWKNYNSIFEEVEVISVSRNCVINDDNRTDLKIKEKFHDLIIENIDISSTEIRKMFNNKTDISHLVPKKVLEIIKMEKLYCDEKRI